MTSAIVSLIILALIAFWCIRTVNDFKKKEIRVQEGLPSASYDVPSAQLEVSGRSYHNVCGRGPRSKLITTSASESYNS